MTISITPRLLALNLALALTGSAALPAAAEAPGEVGDYRSRMEKWVETRQLLSAEQSEWEAEAETLRATRELLREEKRALEEEIASLTESNSAADEERRSLLLLRGELQRSQQSLEERVALMEQQVLALAARLPDPLRKKLELLLVQIPEDPESTRVPIGQRLVSLLGVLAQTEKFDGTATFVGETRAAGGDRKVSVRTLYWGLAQAVYVDSQGESAGIGVPGVEGWEFTNDPDLAGDARRLLDIYEGNVDAIEFVRLPVRVEGKARAGVEER